MKKCANCRESKRRRSTTVYCRLYGIEISEKYNKCESYKPKIVEIENAEETKERKAV